MTGPIAECIECKAQFTAEQIETAESCPGCGTKAKPRAIGSDALALELVNEYLAVKSMLVGRHPSGVRITPRDMTTRQQAGLLIRTFGLNEVLQKFASMPRFARRNYQKQWPNLVDLLKKAGARE